MAVSQLSYLIFNSQLTFLINTNICYFQTNCFICPSQLSTILGHKSQDKPTAKQQFLILNGIIMEGTQVLLKLISVGDVKVGKSCIIKRYCEGRFVQKYITTIGVDYGVKKVNVSGRKVAVNFFDLSGSPDYQEIRNPFYQGAQVILLVFDLQCRESFNNLGKWETVMKNYGVNSKEAVVILVGNKCDGRVKEVDQTQVIAYAKKRGYQYFPCSASTGQNINQIFDKAFLKAVSLLEDKLKTIQ